MPIPRRRCGSPGGKVPFARPALSFYGPDFALLQVTFPPDSRSPRSAKVDDCRKVFRATEEGEYAQVQQDTQKVRWVTIMYSEGSLPIRSVTPVFPDAVQEKSPSHASTEARGMAKSVQQIQWWCKRHGVWQCYGDIDNRKLEIAYDPPQRVRVAVCEGHAVVDMISKTESNNDGSVNPVLRARWHVQRSDGTLLPFSEIDGANLEQGLVLGPMEFVADHYFAQRLEGLRARQEGAARRSAADPAHRMLDGRLNPMAWEWLGAQCARLDRSHPEESLAALSQVLEALAGDLPLASILATRATRAVVCNV